MELLLDDGFLQDWSIKYRITQITELLYIKITIRGISPIRFVLMKLKYDISIQLKSGVVYFIQCDKGDTMIDARKFNFEDNSVVEHKKNYKKKFHTRFPTY